MQPSNNGFNLKVVYAENGYGYTIPVNPSVLIESIKQSLITATGLSPYDQILLSDKNLAPNKTLESYGIVKDKEIYLFNRKILDNYNLKPEEVDVSLQDFRKIPKKPTPNNLSDFESSPNPLNKLYAMEYHLNNHMIGIKFIKDEFERKLVTCQNYQSDIHHQKKALNAASFSFFDYRDNLANTVNKFIRDFKVLIPNYDSILSSFELDMSKLKQVKLHDSLKSNNRVTLADCVPEADFRKWHKQCKEEFDALKTKILDLDNQIYNTIKISDSELKRPDPINMNELSGRMQVLKEHFERVKATNLSFSSNYEKIKLTLDQTRTINDPNRILSMLSGFLDIKKQQDDSFSYCSNNTNAFEAISFICKSKNFMNSHVYNYLRSISKFQEKFREIKPTLSLYDEAINKFSDNFIQLEIIHRLPQAYEESLLEIGRRKKFGSNITCSLSRFIESLKSIRDNENEKRQMFVNKYLQYIPISSFHGLKEQLPEFIVSLPPFDTNLPSLGGNISSTGVSGGINNNSNSNSSGNNLGSGFSGSNGSNEDDGFTLVIDNLADNFNNNFINNNNNNNNSLNSLVNSSINNNLTSSNINNSIISNNNKKLLNDLEKSQIEKQQLEMRLQTTFLMASKSEEKYKDLLEKSKMYSDSFLDKQTNESKRIEELKKELEDKKREITLLSDELAKASEDTLVNQQLLITLQEQNNELTSVIEVLKSKIQESETSLETLQKDHLLKENAYNEQMTSAMEDFNDKKNTIDTLRTEIHQSTSKITELEELITNLQLENQTGIKENQNLVIENGQLKLENDELKLQSSKLLAKVDALKSESDQISLDLNTTIQSLTIENDMLKLGTNLKIGEFETKTLQLGETTNKLEQVNRSLQDTISNLNTEKETLAQSLSTLKIESLSLQATYQTLQQDNILLQKEKKTLESANERLKQKIVEFEQSLDTAEKESIVEKGKYLKLVDELELLRSELQQSGHSSNEKYQQLQQLNLELAKERQQHQQSDQINKQLEQQNQSLQDEQKASSEKFTALSESYNTVKQLLNEQMEEVEKSNETNNELSSTVNKLNNEITKLQQEVEKLSSKLSQSQQSLTSTLDQTTRNYQAKIISLDQQISHLESLNQETQKESLFKENENNNLKSEVETLRIELERSKATESKHTKDLEDLQGYFNTELSRVDAEYDKLKLKNDENLANNASLKEVMKKDKIIHKKEMESLAEKEKHIRDQEKSLDEKDKVIAEKDKFITDLRNKVNQTTNLMPEVQSLRSAVYEISKIINPANATKEPLDPDALVAQVNKIFIEDMFQSHQLLDRVSNLETQQALERSQSAIISNFTHDRNVIFFKNRNGFYEAVNIDSPNYFLSPISLEQYSEEMKPDQPFIGSIIQVDCKIAGNSDSFGCLPGTEFFEVLVSKLEN